MGKYDKEISDALRAHGSWKLRLKTGIGSGKLSLPAAEISKDHVCDFGCWLESAKRDSAIAALPEFRQVVGLHREFHQMAGSIAKSIEQGKLSEAQTALDQGAFDTASRQLGAALMSFKRVS